MAARINPLLVWHGRHGRPPSVVEFLGLRAGSLGRLWLVCLVMLCGLPTMQQASSGDGLSFDPFPFH